MKEAIRLNLDVMRERDETLPERKRADRPCDYLAQRGGGVLAVASRHLVVDGQRLGGAPKRPQRDCCWVFGCFRRCSMSW
jgi:hypothetical protein